MTNKGFGADYFSALLSQAAPSLERLVSLGISVSDAEEILRSFRLPRLAARVNVAELTDGALDELLHWYDCSTLQIGLISFFPTDDVTTSGRVIGAAEADHLVLDQVTGEIIVEELDSDGHVLWSCASGGENLLRALVLAADYLGRCMAAPQPLPSDEGNAALVACTQAAGGEKYRPFFSALLGLD